MELFTLVLIISILIGGFCIWLQKTKKDKEHMGGFGTITALAFYNRQNHCWKNLYDDGISCGTDSKLML